MTSFIRNYATWLENIEWRRQPRRQQFESAVGINVEKLLVKSIPWEISENRCIDSVHVSKSTQRFLCKIDSDWIFEEKRGNGAIESRRRHSSNKSKKNHYWCKTILDWIYAAGTCNIYFHICAVDGEAVKHENQLMYVRNLCLSFLYLLATSRSLLRFYNFNWLWLFVNSYKLNWVEFCVTQ